MTSAIASLDNIIAPSTDCSASIDCGGVRSNSAGPDDGRVSLASVIRHCPPYVSSNRCSHAGSQPEGYDNFANNPRGRRRRGIQTVLPTAPSQQVDLCTHLCATSWKSP